MTKTPPPPPPKKEEKLKENHLLQQKKKAAVMFVVTRYKKRTLNIIETVYTPRETTDPLKIYKLIHVLTRRG